MVTLMVIKIKLVFMMIMVESVLLMVGTIPLMAAMTRPVVIMGQIMVTFQAVVSSGNGEKRQGSMAGGGG